MAKDKDDARAEGFARGVKGQSSAGMTQGWTDDQVATVARNEGWVAGKRQRARDEALEAKAAKKKK